MVFFPEGKLQENLGTLKKKRHSPNPNPDKIKFDRVKLLDEIRNLC